MSQQRVVARGELLLVAHVVHRRREPVRTMFQRHAAQIPQRVLQPFAQAFEALGKAQRDVFPVRVRQHEVVQHVGKAPPADRDSQFVHVREIGLPQPAGHVLLRKEHLPARTFGRPPPLDSPLQRVELPVGEPARVLPLQCLEKRLRLQPRVRLHLLTDFLPHVLERIDPRSPVPFRFPLTGEPGAGQLLPRGLHIHSGLGGRQFLCLLCFRQPFQPPDLCVGHHLRCALKRVFDGR